MRKHGKAPTKPADPIDPTLVSIATKIVERSTIGRRWYFHNSVCIAFYRAPDLRA